MKKVLVVEDNDKNLYLITFLLQTLKCEVHSAITGEIGVEMAKTNQYNLILMDIQLPGMDGYETTKAIRSSGKNVQTPIVAITSFAMVGDKEKTLAVGCNGYIEKPINPETILDELKNFLNI